MRRQSTYKTESHPWPTVGRPLVICQPLSPIIDEIDRVLAEHYGFTDEELDFILNYDIKYRLGADGGEE